MNTSISLSGGIEARTNVYYFIEIIFDYFIYIVDHDKIIKFYQLLFIYNQ